MKKNLIYSLFAFITTFLFVSCEKDIDQNNIGNYEFYIDSIYNVTETSVTIQATLYTEKVEKRIIGLEIYCSHADDESKGFRQSFVSKEGTVTMVIENLEPNTEYNVRPMVKIEHYLNMSTGSPLADRTFTTKGNLPNSGTVEDIDGNLYHFITIGNQTWMVENLKTTRLRDGTPIPYVKDSLKWCLSMAKQTLQTSLSYCDYNNDSTFGKKYGHIYDIQASKSDIAPKGWHVPTRSDWFILRNYLIANGYNYDKSTEDNKTAKSLASNTKDWLSEGYSSEGSIVKNLDLNNATGFTALPGGFRSRDGEFKNAGYTCPFWSSTPYYQYNYYVELNSYSDALYMGESWEFTGMYIRCIRNN
jgi:uncharacterized protein (TIGR02145 family)